MGNLPSTVSCDPATPSLNPSGPYGLSGRLFTSSCQFDTTGPVLSISSASFYDCITSCGSNTACKAISWTYGTCYQKSSIGKLIASDAVSSFTALDAGVELSCPTSDGQTYTSQRGNFAVECGTDYPGIGDMGSSSQPSFTSCINTCASTSGCVAVVYSGDACYMKNAVRPRHTQFKCSGRGPDWHYVHTSRI